MITTRGIFAAAFGAVLAAGSLAACASAPDTVADDAAALASTEPSAEPPSVLSAYRSVRTYDETAVPVRLRIPAIGVDTGLEELGLKKNRSIEVPQDPSSAGWWAGGVRPGQVGPAVILGHLDTKHGAAVFHQVPELEPGDEILVDRADGTTVRFLVTSLDSFPKADFPSELVYYPTVEAELRLVTCIPPFDHSTGHYRDNLVVFAAQAR
jgi:sortase (surface protein transpeptidase)